MVDYTELANPDPDDGATPSALWDPRSWFVSMNFVVVTMTSSLFVFLLMERYDDSSFLELVNQLSTFNVLSAATVFVLLFLSAVSVVAVWMRNRRLLSLANATASVFAGALILVLVWAILLSNGSYADDLHRGFINWNNLTSGVESACPTIPGGRCCGWGVACPAATCNDTDKLCDYAVQQNVNEYVERLIPVLGIILSFHLVAAVFACSSRSWKLSPAQSAHVPPPSHDGDGAR